jgi:hypothetical protein
MSFMSILGLALVDGAVFIDAGMSDEESHHVVLLHGAFDAMLTRRRIGAAEGLTSTGFANQLSAECPDLVGKKIKAPAQLLMKLGVTGDSAAWQIESWEQWESLVEKAQREIPERIPLQSRPPSITEALEVLLDETLGLA